MNLESFLSQGGYAFFVWGAYGMAALLLVAEILLLRQRRRTILSRIGRLIRMRAQETDHESQT
jgi:heme exporter protein D